MVHLNDGLQNDNFLKEAKHFAIEHASSDVGNASAVKAMHAFATANPQRKDLLLGQRAPLYNDQLTLTRSYHHSYDEVLLRIKTSARLLLARWTAGNGQNFDGSTLHC